MDDGIDREVGGVGREEEPGICVCHPLDPGFHGGFDGERPRIRAEEDGIEGELRECRRPNDCPDSELLIYLNQYNRIDSKRLCRHPQHHRVQSRRLTAALAEYRLKQDDTSLRRLYDAISTELGLDGVEEQGVEVEYPHQRF